MLLTSCTDVNKVVTEGVQRVPLRQLCLYRGLPFYVVRTRTTEAWEFVGLDRESAILGAQKAVADGIVRNREVPAISIDDQGKLSVSSTVQDVETVSARAQPDHGRIWKVVCNRRDEVVTFELAVATGGGAA